MVFFVAMWHVDLGLHAIEFPKTSAIFEVCFWFRFRSYHRSRHVILHHSPKFYPNRTAFSVKKLTSCRFSRWRISAFLNFMGPILGYLKSPCTTSYRSSVEIIALNCLVFEKIAFFCILATNKLTDRQTDKQIDRPVALSRSRCRERRLNKTVQ